ncbi:MAG: hypothetical protein R2911_03565 [Caldilineaceae bacterium]
MTTIQGDLNNTATAAGNPTDANGVDLPDLANPSATDTAASTRLPRDYPGQDGLHWAQRRRRLSGR